MIPLGLAIVAALPFAGLGALLLVEWLDAEIQRASDEIEPTPRDEPYDWSAAGDFPARSGVVVPMQRRGR